MNQEPQRPRRWHLQRKADESGMSGVGRVAEGVELPNGVAVMWWLVPPYSIQAYRTLDDLRHIHGHGDRKTSEVVYDDEAGGP